MARYLLSEYTRHFEENNALFYAITFCKSPNELQRDEQRYLLSELERKYPEEDSDKLMRRLKSDESSSLPPYEPDQSAMNLVKTLVSEYPVLCNVVDSEGRNCIFYAAGNAQLQVLEYMRNKGARCNVPVLVLKFMIENHNDPGECVRAIVHLINKWNFNLLSMDKNGNTLLDYIAEATYHVPTEIIKLLVAMQTWRERRVSMDNKVDAKDRDVVIYQIDTLMACYGITRLLDVRVQGTRTIAERKKIAERTAMFLEEPNKMKQRKQRIKQRKQKDQTKEQNKMKQRKQRTKQRKQKDQTNKEYEYVRKHRKYHNELMDARERIDKQKRVKAGKNKDQTSQKGVIIVSWKKDDQNDKHPIQTIGLCVAAGLILSMFILSKDITMLIINGRNDCNQAIGNGGSIGESDWLSLHLNTFILIGCIGHIVSGSIGESDWLSLHLNTFILIGCIGHIVSGIPFYGVWIWCWYSDKLEIFLCFFFCIYLG
eukprot:248678_1